MAEATPGAGLAYEDLLDAACHDRDIRHAWSELTAVAELLGIVVEGAVPRKTIDRLTDDINEMLPEGSTPDDLISAVGRSVALSLSEQVGIQYVVHHFREVGDHWEFVPFETHDDLAEAERCRDFWSDEDNGGGIYVIVKTTTRRTREVIR